MMKGDNAFYSDNWLNILAKTLIDPMQDGLHDLPWLFVNLTKICQSSNKICFE